MSTRTTRMLKDFMKQEGLLADWNSDGKADLTGNCVKQMRKKQTLEAEYFSKQRKKRSCLEIFLDSF